MRPQVPGNNSQSCFMADNYYLLHHFSVAIKAVQYSPYIKGSLIPSTPPQKKTNYYASETYMIKSFLVGGTNSNCGNYSDSSEMLL